jgi:hypothetical protein
LAPTDHYDAAQTARRLALDPQRLKLRNSVKAKPSATKAVPSGGTSDANLKIDFPPHGLNGHVSHTIRHSRAF